MQREGCRGAFAGFHRARKKIEGEDFHFGVCEDCRIVLKAGGERWVWKSCSKPNIFFADGGVKIIFELEIRLDRAVRSDQVMNTPESLPGFGGWVVADTYLSNLG